MMREHRALDAILEPGGITPMYQPIVAIDGGPPKLIAFECLSRGPHGTNFESAKVLFDYVRLKREETLVDRACIAAVLAKAPRNPGIRLTLNAHASTLGRDHGFTEFVCATADAHGIAREAITIEIVEHAPPWDSIGFFGALERLRQARMRVALDDVGLGQSNFKMILDVRPDYLKIDQYFVEHCDSDRSRQAVIEAVSTLGAHFGAEIIAEGVEREEVRDALERFGVRYMQGYLFGKPMNAADAAKLADQSTANVPGPDASLLVA